MKSEADSHRRQKERLAPDSKDTLRIRLPWYGGQRREALCIILDASAEGAGILMAESLANGTRVTIDGRVGLRGQQYSLSGQAQVVNSRTEDRGLYRVGLQFLDVAWQRLDAEAAVAQGESAATKA